MNELIEFIENDLRISTNNSYVVCLSDNAIILSTKDRIGHEIERFSDEKIGMLDLILSICKKIVEKFPIEDAFSSIELHNFLGMEALIDKGPIQIYFETEDERTFSISWTSSIPKSREWIEGYLNHVRGKEDNNDEYIELDNYIEALEDGYYKLKGSSK